MADISIFKSYSGYIGPEEGFSGKRGLFGLNRDYRDYKKAMAALGPIRDNAVQCLSYLQKVRFSYYPGAFQRVWNDVVNILGTLGVFSNNALSYQASDAKWTYAPGWDRNVKVSELDGPEALWLIQDGLGFSSYTGDAEDVKKQYFVNNFIPRMINFCTSIAVSNHVQPDKGFSFRSDVFSSSERTVQHGNIYDRILDYSKQHNAPSLSDVREMEKRYLDRPRNRGMKR